MSTIEKLRGPKVWNMAIFDWVATGAVAALIGRLVRNSFVGVMSFIILVLLAIILHFALGVPTELNAKLGLANRADVLARRRSIS